MQSSSRKCERCSKSSSRKCDFVIQILGNIVPIEVKAEQNLRAKSLGEFIKKYKPPYVVRTSMSAYSKGEIVTDLPLFAISLLPDLLIEAKLLCGATK